MKTLFALTAAAACVVCGMPSAQAHPTAYKLVCHGGGDMFMSYHDTGSSRSLDIVFEPAVMGAQQEAPGPGECAWVDRPVYASEPHRLRYYTSERITDVNVRNPYELVLIADGTSLNYLLNGTRSDALFYVYAYNGGLPSAPALIVTRVGP